jgi:hypothetical protein
MGIGAAVVSADWVVLVSLLEAPIACYKILQRHNIKMGPKEICCGRPCSGLFWLWIRTNGGLLWS